MSNYKSRFKDVVLWTIYNAGIKAGKKYYDYYAKDFEIKTSFESYVKLSKKMFGKPLK